MGNTDYESRVFAAEMKLWNEYKTLSNANLMSIVEKALSLQRRVAARALSLRGGEDVVSYALTLCLSENYKLRETGAYMLGQTAIPSQEKLLEVTALLASLALRDKSIRVRYTAVYALGHRCAKGFVNNRLMLSLLAKAVADASASVRNAAAFALSAVKSSRTAPLLAKLLGDSDQDVRNWAGFAVNQSGADSLEIRKALVAMLDDPFEEARLEAIYALASRRDRRVVQALKHELGKDYLILTVVEATAELGDAEFIPILEKLLDEFNDEEGIIQRSIDQLKRKIK